MLNQPIFNLYGWHAAEGAECGLPAYAIAYIARCCPDSGEGSYTDITQNFLRSLGQRLVRISNQVDETRYSLRANIHQDDLRTMLPLFHAQSIKEPLQCALTLR